MQLPEKHRISSVTQTHKCELEPLGRGDERNRVIIHGTLNLVPESR